MNVRELLERQCPSCKENKSINEFHKNFGKRGIRRICKVCTNEENRKSYFRNKDSRRKNQVKYERKIRSLAKSDKSIQAKMLVKLARTRAKKYGVPFSIKVSDINIPERCPILGLVLKMNAGTNGPDSASIDRIIPSMGYVPGNVLVISLKANMIKTSASPEEIMMVANYFMGLKA